MIWTTDGHSDGDRQVRQRHRPIVFAIVAEWTGGGRHAILALVVFFVIGMSLLRFVDVDEGRLAAMEAERALLAR